MKIKPAEEWFKQVEYDFKSAEAMLESSRYIFILYLCVIFQFKKALKGIFAKVFK